MKEGQETPGAPYSREELSIVSPEVSYSREKLSIVSPEVSLENWNGSNTTFAVSAGGVLAFLNPLDALLRGEITIWPTAEIIQKLYKSHKFKGNDLADAEEVLGFYCDLQSINSEDAITWNTFGLIAHTERAIRRNYCVEFFDLIDSDLPCPQEAQVALWKRIPHPDNFGSSGPELDFMIQSEKVVIFGEAKWNSSVGKNQGENRDKNQITLRKEFFEKLGNKFFPNASYFVILGVSNEAPVVKKEDICLSNGVVLMRNIPWKSVCSINSHPLADELEKYYNWKKKYSKSK